MGVFKEDIRSLDDSSIRFGCGCYGAYSNTMLKGSYRALISCWSRVTDILLLLLCCVGLHPGLGFVARASTPVLAFSKTDHGVVVSMFIPFQSRARKTNHIFAGMGQFKANLRKWVSLGSSALGVALRPQETHALMRP